MPPEQRALPEQFLLPIEYVHSASTGKRLPHGFEKTGNTLERLGGLLSALDVIPLADT